MTDTIESLRAELAAPGELYCGDNLDVLRDFIPRESVDLIYLDPPFNSDRDYNEINKGSEAQKVAFKDSWSWEEAAPTYSRLLKSVELPKHLRPMLVSLHDLLVENDSGLLAYLVMMAPRLVALHRVLKPSGSLYLHCDPTASHYLKVVLDAIFGPERFCNEVIWKRANAHNDPKRYGRISDTLLFYSKGSAFTWNPQYTPYREEYYKSHYKQDAEGRFFRTVPLDAPRHGEGTPALLYSWKGKLPSPTRTWGVKQSVMERYEAEGKLRYTRTGTPTLLQYADEMAGVPLQNIWTDIPPVNPQAKERLPYPTQKPLKLLNRIIEASSNPGDLILDPFCGCGTTVEAAERMGRRYIGIDFSRGAIDMTIQERFVKHGLPVPPITWLEEASK